MSGSWIFGRADMERLTKIDGIGENEMIRCFDCCIEKAGENLENCGYCKGFRKVIDRLTAYEDTGLTPEEVTIAKHALMGKSVAQIREFDGVPIARLCELAQAEKDGRLVVLPCKEGDTVYFRTWTKNATVDLGVQPHEVTAIRAYVIVPGEYSNVGLPVDHFGKTVFLTREEAERALVADTNVGRTVPVNDLYDEEGADVMKGGFGA